MKKIVYFLAVLCVGMTGFAQSYDYDRIPPSSSVSSVWFTVSLDKSVLINLPPEASYGRIVIFENEVDAGDMFLQFKRTSIDNSTHLFVTRTLKENMNTRFREINPIKFILESNGETIVSTTGNKKEYTESYLVKMVWRNADGELNKKYIAKIY